MSNPNPPRALRAGGTALWRQICEAYDDLDPMQLVQLTEACRAKDRLDEFDSIIHGKGVLDLMRFRLHESWGEEGDRTVLVEVKFDNVIATANATANLMKQLLAAMRLPDASGKRPQFRGPRGTQQPSVPGGADTGTAKGRARQRWGA